MSIKIFNFIFVLLFSFGLQAEALDIPALNSPVIDEVGLLSSQSKRQLEDTLFNFKQSSGIQFQVYVIKSLGGDSIESVAIQVFDKWKLGDEKLDRGLLFLIAPNEKRLRIEVGQGLEGDLPDVIAKRIISDVVAPYFKRGEFAVGIFQGVSTVQNYLVNTDPEQKAKIQENASESQTGGKSDAWVFILIAIVWFIIFLINPSLALHILFAAMSGGRGGGGGGGRTWSGGGGRSSGGGASGGW